MHTRSKGSPCPTGGNHSNAPPGDLTIACAALQILEQESTTAPPAAIYLTEALTALSAYVNRRFVNVTRSEFLGDGNPPGVADARGVRHESLMSLSFPDGSFDTVLSFDVLEHVPDPAPALAEVLRVLRPGGRFLFTVPFLIESQSTLVRARANPDGSVTHLLEPEFHGDPLRSEGILCLRHFAWDLLEEMAAVGYDRVDALLYWSEEFAYLGREQVMFLARKRTRVGVPSKRRSRVQPARET
ncbi:MAG: class I SAM-dependent methyltransferase [Acidobacteriota bacterium]